MSLLRKFSLIAVSVFALPTAALAQGQKEFKDLNPWADCGIGAMIFSNYPVAAVISNVIWDLGTTAVSSAGTSTNTCSGKNATAALFIQESYANLEEETAQGDGQHMRAMLSIFGCKAASQSDIIGAVRAQFAQALQHANYAQQPLTTKAQYYYHIVNTNVSSKFAQQCSAI